MDSQNGDIEEIINQKIIPNLNADKPYSVIYIVLSLIDKESDNFLDILEIICKQSQKKPIHEDEEQQRIKEIVEPYLNQTNIRPKIPKEQQQFKDEINIETEEQILKTKKEILEAKERALEAREENLELKKMLYQQSLKSDNKTFFMILIVILLILLPFTPFGQFIFKSVIVLGPEISNPEKDEKATRENTTFKSVKEVPGGKFNYLSSRSWATAANNLDPSIKSSKPEFLIKAEFIGSEDAKKNLLKNKTVPFIVVSNPFTGKQLEEIRENQGFQLEPRPVALDGVVLIVHKSLNISELTKEQIKDIYTGKITNWEDVGGPNAPIIPISSKVETSGTAALFQKKVLDGEEFRGVKMFQSNQEAKEELENNPYGLFYVTAAQSVEDCKFKPLKIKNEKTGEFIAPYKGNLVDNCPRERNQINVEAFKKEEYPFTRKIYVVIKLDGGKHQKAGEAYANFVLTEEGQNLIEEKGKLVRYR